MSKKPSSSRAAAGTGFDKERLIDPHLEDLSAALEDDGHTIADMSMLDDGPHVANNGSSRDIREELGDPDDRRALIFGATWAGLSIGLVYIVVFGIVIALMLWFFSL